MTIRNEALELIFAARNMNDNDALELITARLAAIHKRGVKSGREQARQAIGELVAS